MFLLLLLFGAVSCQRGRLTVPIPGEYLGQFEVPTHQVQGHLYGLNDTTLYIHRFYYDHAGKPPAVEIVAVPIGTTDYAEGIPVNVRQGEENLGMKLDEAFYNVDLIIDLPFSNTELDRLVVWCREFRVSFGRVDVTEARENGFQAPPTLEEVGSFQEPEHNVSGVVYIQDEKTIVIRDFTYDGAGPSVYFYAGETDRVEEDGGKFVAYPTNRTPRSRRLRRHFRKDITLKLPGSMTTDTIKWISVWCDAFGVSFGHVYF